MENPYNILQLNDDILGKILSYLDVEDHVSVAQTCVRFRGVVKDWAPILYPEFPIRKYEIDQSNVKKEIAYSQLFGIICDRLQDVYIHIQANLELDGNDEYAYWKKNICDKLSSMPALRQISLKLPYQCNESIVDCFTVALQRVPDLKHLLLFGYYNGTSIFRCVNLEEFVSYSEINSVLLEAICRSNPKLRIVELNNSKQQSFIAISLHNNLEKIRLYGKINSHDLSQICKSNQNLRVLELTNSSINIQWLSDIVPYCKNLEKLQVECNISSEDLAPLCKSNPKLSFLDLSNFSGNLEDIIPHCRNLEKFLLTSENIIFGPLAELPKLIELHIDVNNIIIAHQTIKNLSLREPQQLHTLNIFDCLNSDMISDVARIKSIKDFFCIVSDVSSIEQLSQLTELETLHIRILNDQLNSSYPTLISILKSCTKLTNVILSNVHITNEFFNEVMNVLKKVRDPIKQRPLEIIVRGLTWVPPRNPYLHMEYEIWNV